MFLGSGSAINAARRDDGVPKEDLYTFIVERSSPTYRQPWLLMAALTLAVPIAALFLSHWAVAPDLLQKQGAIILLFFGWVTGRAVVVLYLSCKHAKPLEASWVDYLFVYHCSHRLYLD